VCVVVPVLNLLNPKFGSLRETRLLAVVVTQKSKILLHIQTATSVVITSHVHGCGDVSICNSQSPSLPGVRVSQSLSDNFKPLVDTYGRVFFDFLPPPHTPHGEVLVASFYDDPSLSPPWPFSSLLRLLSFSVMGQYVKMQRLVAPLSPFLSSLSNTSRFLT
jgi:hypothetical protein